MLNAKQLLEFLSMLETDGHDLRKVKVNYRYDADSDVESCKHISEDLFDDETNSKLTSIVLSTKP